MNCEEVKISLHDFVDELLDDKIKREIEIHLKICDNCFAQYKRIRRFYDKLKDLPFTIEPPSNIVEILSQELLKRAIEERPEEISKKTRVNLKKIKREQLKQEKHLKKTRGVVRKNMVSSSIYTTSLIKPAKVNLGLDFKRVLLTLLPLILIGIGYFIYDFTLINSPWKVRTISGRVLINGAENESNRLYEGESIVTEQLARAIVYVPNTARIELGENTFIILLKAKDGSNKIKLIKGSIIVNNSELMPALEIEVNNFVIHDRGGIFSITLDENSNAKISVDYAYLEIEQKGRRYFVDEGHICELRDNLHPGTPYRKEVPDELKNAISKLDYEGGGDEVVSSIINLSSSSDALTLLAIIPRVSEVSRKILFDKIALYFPPPEGVTVEGILKLDRDMLELWWNEIEWQI